MSIERLTESLDKATSGPWEYDSTFREITNAQGFVGEFKHPEAAEAVVALRNAAPELLAVVEAARAYLEGVSPHLNRTDEEDALRKTLRALDATGGDDGESRGRAANEATGN